jgi:hypothetical protein
LLVVATLVSSLPPFGPLSETMLPAPPVIKSARAASGAIRISIPSSIRPITFMMYLHEKTDVPGHKACRQYKTNGIQRLD